MKFQSKIIAFCYLYIIGIAAAMLWPLDLSWIPWFKVLTAAVIIPGAVLFLYAAASWNIRQEKKKIAFAARWLWPLLFLGAVSMGFTRYLDANTIPDMRVGEIRIDGDQRAFVQSASLPDTSRLRIRKTDPIDGDLRIRLIGELDARVPVRDADGRCTMDEEARWQFQIARLALTSEVVTVSAADAEGAGYVIDQPFSRITGVLLVDGPDRARVGVERISNHLGSFVRPGRGQSAVTILGQITGDPRVYDFKTVLIITPEFIQYPAGGPFFRVEGGDMQVTVNPDMTGYTQYARTDIYGADIEVRGELTMARGSANPGGFDANEFMQNYNIFGLLNARQPRGEEAPIQVIRPGGGERRTGNPLVAFSLDLRDRLLAQFKATMPYPESAFLGGVTLGLRYGLPGVMYPGEGINNAFGRAVGLSRSEALIVDDFKASGVNHVLAVSGLHVTIITAMFMGIFALMRLPKTFYVPVIIMALVIFAIITGARPSTLRAVIMNSLFLLTWGYLDRGLWSSVMIGVPVAAFMILLHNPLVVIDPSFTLSFGAILSLALLTMPAHDVLSHLRGNQFLAVIVLGCATTVIGMMNWMLVVTPSFVAVWLAFCVILVVLAGELQKRGIGISPNFAFSALPQSISTFAAAQVAIQIGMMIPLSAYYFCRWPFGGAYANLIAIPLIGIVVQLGAIAGLVGLIPVVGPFLALLLNAANWVFTTFFLWLAHVFTMAFPYPYVRRPTEIEVLVFYFFVAGFVWNKPIRKWIHAWCERRGWTHRAAPWLMGSGLCLLAALPLLFAPPRDARPPGLHVNILSVGYGSSIVVESPGGRKILIDGGFVEHERARRNEAERTVIPFLCHMNIRRLDGFILTSPLPERSAGAAFIVPQVGIRNLILPPSLAELDAGMSFDSFLDTLSAGRDLSDYDTNRLHSMYHELVGHPEWTRRPSLAKALAACIDTPVNRWAGRVVERQVVKAGMALFEETVDGKTFRIEVLGPGEPLADGDFPVEDDSLALRIVYGDFALLMPGMLHYEGQRRLASAWSPDQLRAQVLVVPHQGAAVPGGLYRPERRDVLDALARGAGPLLDKVRPEKAIIEFGNPRPVLGDGGRPAVNAYEITRQFYEGRLGEADVLSTDRQLAVSIHSDGVTYSIETQADRNRAEGGEEDAVSDISVGL